MRLIFLFVTLLSVKSYSLETIDLIGQWQYTEFLYQGQTQPLPNPDLVLIFEFDLQGTQTVFWTRKDQPGFCEAKSMYQIINNYLVSEIYWTNPANNSDCSQDPDMQLGKRTFSPIEIISGKIFLNIGLAGESFYYIFTRIEPEAI